ncbi:hypothetical protein HYZ76_01160 [Candidatus Falkowbacteria bacterium]|nr:hypothetical protein [Candidatus Falkowbacteria bacterium]
MIFYFNKQSIFSSYFSNKFVIINLIIAIFLNAVLWLWLGGQAKGFAKIIPLHYNIYFGIDLIGNWYQIFFLPALGLCLGIINSFFGWAMFSREKLISFFLVGSSSFMQLILLLAAVTIIIINQ